MESGGWGKGEGGYVNGGSCVFVGVYTAVESSISDPDPIQVAKPMRIHVDPILGTKKLNF